MKTSFSSYSTRYIQINLSFYIMFTFQGAKLIIASFTLFFPFLLIISLLPQPPSGLSPTITPTFLHLQEKNKDRDKRFRPLYDIPYMFEAREFLRKKLIGKKVRSSVTTFLHSVPQFMNGLDSL